jgi:hypothetical protein
MNLVCVNFSVGSVQGQVAASGEENSKPFNSRKG